MIFLWLGTKQRNSLLPLLHFMEAQASKIRVEMIIKGLQIGNEQVTKPWMFT